MELFKNNKTDRILGEQWLPLAEFSLRSGMSISTIRRKIKSNTIRYRMEDGRYMISLEGFEAQELKTPPPPTTPFVSSDEKPRTTPIIVAKAERGPLYGDKEGILSEEELLAVRKMLGDNALYMRALEARVSGLAKRLEVFSEQVAELKMLVKIFEEKMDSRG